MTAHEGYHEPLDELSDKTREMHRAVISLMEELEAADWYNQRVDACNDDDLRSILVHNRDEEKEHAAMLLEWIRRNDPVLDQVLKTYLFSSGAITEMEAEVTVPQPSDAGQTERLEVRLRPRFTVGSLVGK